MSRYIVRVQSKGSTYYIHLPKELVTIWNLKKGDYVEIIINENVAILRKV